MKRTLGILGGMGSMASAVFYKMIVDNTIVEKDQDHLEMLVYNHAQIPDRTEYILAGREDELYEVLYKDLSKLELFGCEVLTLICNTSYYFYNRLSEEISANIINMPYEALKEATKDGAKKVGIMATNGTVRGGIYDMFSDGLEVEIIYPNDEFQEINMDFIYNQVKKGEKGSLSDFNKVSQHLFEKGAEKIILACTEFSVFSSYNELSDKFIDAMKVLADRSIELCGGKK